MYNNGFTNYDIDFVVKFGGSLLGKDFPVKDLMECLAEFVGTGTRALVIPGGGPTDLTVEALNVKYSFDISTCHYACALAQDQTGLMLADSVFSTRAATCYTLADALAILNERRLPVVLPSRILFSLEPVERTWSVTSDAVAAWFAWVLGARHFVVLTNVDGIFKNGDIGIAEKLIPRISADEAVKLGHTSLDAVTPGFLARKKMNCWILNGGMPDRLTTLLDGGTPIGTFIVGEEST